MMTHVRLRRQSPAMVAFVMAIVSFCAARPSLADDDTTNALVLLISNLQAKVDRVEAERERMRRQLYLVEKQRDEALRLVDQAQQQVDNALFQKRAAVLQRDAALRKADRVRQQKDQEIAQLRRQSAKTLDAVHTNYDIVLKRTQDKLASSEQTAASWKNEAESWQARSHRLEAAFNDYRGAWEQRRKGALDHYMKGKQLFESGKQYEMGIKWVTKAIETYPNDARFFYLRAMLRQQLGDSPNLALPDNAAEDARRGALFEKLATPATSVVDRSLERIQGKPRIWLEQYRYWR